jgi:hypothetical protein
VLRRLCESERHKKLKNGENFRMGSFNDDMMGGTSNTDMGEEEIRDRFSRKTGKEATFEGGGRLSSR